MNTPTVFEDTSLHQILEEEQLVSNYFPCCFTPWTLVLQPGASNVIWEFYGQSDSMEQMRSFCERINSVQYFEMKQGEARKLCRQITDTVKCKTANSVFDKYIEQNFLDNVMRGGFPYQMPENGQPIYIYSRKHGDPEREYNYLCISVLVSSHRNSNSAY